MLDAGCCILDVHLLQITIATAAPPNDYLKKPNCYVNYQLITVIDVTR